MNVQDMTKGQTYTVTTDKATVTGTFVSINSKGVNLTVDGKIRSFALGRVTSVTSPTVDTDGLTTREVAALFDMEAKVLRVHLRAMGAGVGKGRRYGFTSEDVEAIRTHLTNA